MGAQGSGITLEQSLEIEIECPKCGGTGEMEHIVGEYRGWNNVIEPDLAYSTCNRCDGAGTILEEG